MKEQPPSAGSKKDNKNFFRQTWVEVDKSDFHFNLKKIKEYLKKDTKILAVIKSNGYGHGGVELAKEAVKAGVYGIAVSSIEEGIQFRKAGIKTNLLVFGVPYPIDNLSVSVYWDLIPTLTNLHDIQYLASLAKKLGKTLEFHLKIDTGMGRIGVSPQDSYNILQKIAEMPEVKMAGIYTHFAVADSDLSYTQNQLEIFHDITRYAKKLGLRFIAHVANTAALISNKKTHFDMVRPGIGLYGLTPFDHAHKMLKLKPVLSWKTRIINLKRVSAGFCVSYGRTFVTNKASVIATLPVGYADGYSRVLSNKGDVLVRGKRCPIAGRITMDSMMVDVTGIKGVSLGDEVVLIGMQGKEKIKAEELAKLQNTINYEVTCSISMRVPRIVV
ncbi:MAG: alanine racemase [Endomicrobiaceae bacterium]|jgi:alanine racemase|nr:alanine racemase [Endomicrobiaceae bacterium]MDD3729692.1 alanine racemase [Endomicrobiaceae bacterium]MDD4165786.1 alanine racemase [Endomicrobiaceae bacterium]